MGTVLWIAYFYSHLNTHTYLSNLITLSWNTEEWQQMTLTMQFLQKLSSDSEQKKTFPAASKQIKSKQRAYF
jgi:LPS O-antigen subunit length determinant protein (WzzB/FepE family)